jgi:hypothetical protein
MMLNIRRLLPAVALAAYMLPACADPIEVANPIANPTAGPVQPQQVPHAANADPSGGDMPEPASLALIGLGVVGLIAFRRKV